MQGSVLGAPRQSEWYLGRSNQDQGNDAVGGSEHFISDPEFPWVDWLLSGIYLVFFQDSGIPESFIENNDAFHWGSEQ